MEKVWGVPNRVRNDGRVFAILSMFILSLVSTDVAQRYVCELNSEKRATFFYITYLRIFYTSLTFVIKG